MERRELEILFEKGFVAAGVPFDRKTNVDILNAVARDEADADRLSIDEAQDIMATGDRAEATMAGLNLSRYQEMVASGSRIPLIERTSGEFGRGNIEYSIFQEEDGLSEEVVVSLKRDTKFLPMAYYYGNPNGSLETSTEIEHISEFNYGPEVERKLRDVEKLNGNKFDPREVYESAIGILIDDEKLEEE